MRTDQYIGLSPRAQEYLEKNALSCFVTTIIEYPKDPVKKTIMSERSVETRLWQTTYDKIEGAFGNTFPLSEYRLSDGTKIREKVQAEPWSSGPCYFTCLVNKRTGEVIEETKWTEEEINEYL